MPLSLRSHLISVRTANLHALTAFYRRLLGEPERAQPERWSWFALPSGGLVIWFDKSAEAGAENRVEACLTVVDLDQSQRDLSTWTTVSPIQIASHGRECFIHDPDGNRVVLYQPKAP